MGIKTLALGSVLGGTLLASGAIFWMGGGTITGAIDYITDADSQLETYEMNESKLIAKLTQTTTKIQSLQDEITAKNKQIADLIAAGEGNTERVAELQAEVTRLTTELAAKTAELDALNAQIEAGNVDLTDDANLIKAEIERLMGEVESANEDAERLQATLDATGDVPTSNTEGVNNAIAAADQALNGTGTGEIIDPVDPIEQPTTLAMIKGTPIEIGASGKLTIDKVTIGFDGALELFELTLTAPNGSNTYTATINGVEKTIRGGETVSLGDVRDLDGKLLKIESGAYVKEFILINE